MEQFKAGRYERYEPGGYDYFVPSEVNYDWVWDDAELSVLLARARDGLDRLNIVGRNLANLDAFARLSSATETVATSRIEGTQTGVSELLLPEEAIAPDMRADWREVDAYQRALAECSKQVGGGPISLEALRAAHRALMSGVDGGERKSPGEFRRAQVRIGGWSIRTARFVPPAYDYVEPLLGDLMNFLYSDKNATPLLVRIAIGHYQFESIHPFLDGNGRIGRMLITLYLQERGLLRSPFERPLLPISRYFEQNRPLYYERLSGGREDGGMLKWVRYFLEGAAATAAFVCEQADDLERKRSEMLSESGLRDLFGRRRFSAARALEALFAKPDAVSVKDVSEICGVSVPAAADLVGRMVACGYLREVTGRLRGKLYGFKPYLDIFG